ncbi:hypothetical protein L6R49_20715 [Myxococcota bacterium]|nr:hypothetical protein [Myxococcota bacterium]
MPSSPPSPSQLTPLLIAKTWDGGAARPDEIVLVTLRRAEGGLVVHVNAPLHGDPPPDAPPGPTWALWEHEVVELFVAGPGEDNAVRYLEVELSPHGHHLVLTLTGRRNIVERCLPLDVTTRRLADRWIAEAWIPPALLPEGPLRVNATAIHGQGATRRYLSHVALPAAAPDFHQPQRFVTLRP